jgi:dihydroorotate dehydrogenase electron transfer subunit
LITNLLEEDIQEGWLPDQIFTCGPKPMLRKIAEIASKVSIDGQVSLEEHMGCGIGACLGCVCKIKTNLSACLPERGRSQSGNAQAEEKNNNKEEYDYKRVCVDGPVFKASEVIWDD